MKTSELPQALAESGPSLLRVLACGDVVGRPGREIIARHIPELRRQWNIDLVIVNGENSAGGQGLDPGGAEELRAAGVDLITLGDHTWQRKQIRGFLDDAGDWCLRPANYPAGAPGSGSAIVSSKKGRVFVANLIGRVFIQSPLDCPFRAVDQLLADRASEVPIRIIDMHAEATSEKIAMAWHLDGRASLVFGTHTHVQTADERISASGTAAITDLGMCGPREGVIGMDRRVALGRFISGLPAAYEVSPGAAGISGVLCEIEISSGKAQRIARVTQEAITGSEKLHWRVTRGEGVS